MIPVSFRCVNGFHSRFSEEMVREPVCVGEAHRARCPDLFENEWHLHLYRLRAEVTRYDRSDNRRESAHHVQHQAKTSIDGSVSVSVARPPTSHLR